jgi:hypothetical protein
MSAAPAHAASWCGTPGTDDRTPELFGGAQIHTVYAYPSDGANRYATFADAMETNAENIESWWRGQDPTRAPRFDLLQFACGPQVDLAVVQEAVPGAQLADAAAAYDRLFDDLRHTGLVSPTDISVVYYDGPESNANTCGIGGGDSTGAGIAVVLVNACSGVASDWVAAHELGHALGAVPVGAPHRCSDSGHTCDNPSDLMYPFITVGEPLTSAILDPGRDDWYGHSGAWWDVQDSPFLKHMDAQVHLSVGITGAGSVESDPIGVECTAACGTDWDSGTEVSLEALPGNGLRFVRWSGACSGSGSCDLVLDEATAVSAFFAPATFRLSVTVSGRGRVVSRPAGLACAKGTCRRAFRSYSPVRLTAKPAKGWRLKAWSGGCRGAKPTCVLPMKAATAARATFARKPA